MTAQPQVQPCPQLARAWWGDQLVAESRAAVQVDQVGRAPQLWFPRPDVAVDQLRDQTVVADHDGRGAARVWSLEPLAADTPVPAPTARDSWDGAQRSPTDGRAVAWTLDGRDGSHDPTASGTSGMITFDHDRVRVELVEGDPDDPGDVSITRFPTWGDAADLITLLQVEPQGDATFVGRARADERRPVVEGSQMLGQAIVAAGRHAPSRRVVAAQMHFLRGADSRRPLTFRLDELSGGRTFTSLAVDVTQDGRRCAAGVLLCDQGAPDLIRHAVAAPEVPGPADSEPFDMSVTGRDLRIVDGAYTSDPDAPVGPPVVDAWVRFRQVPDDPAVHAGLLAQFTGHLSLAAALRPHAGVGQHEAHRTLSMAINAISISFHADVRADRWMLYHHHSTFAGDGMTHAECRVHDEAGALVASFSVEAMARPLPQAMSAAVDDRTAL